MTSRFGQQRQKKLAGKLEIKKFKLPNAASAAIWERIQPERCNVLFLGDDRDDLSISKEFPLECIIYFFPNSRLG
tara:strand:- start:367 stop:591 length:225 start_codon:yes stop_codon:yes gene_type:complete